MDSYEINLIDMFRNIARRWRMMLVYAIIFAILVSCFCVYSNVSFNNAINIREDVEEDINSSNIDELVALTTLTNTEVSDVKTAVKAYNLIEENYAFFDEGYGDNNAYTSSRVMQFVVSAISSENGSSYDLATNVLQSLIQYVNSFGLARSIEANCNGEFSFGDIKACISINYDTKNVSAESSTGANGRSLTFYIICKGKNNEQVESLGKLIENELSSYGRKFNSYGSASIKLVDSYVGGVKNSDTNNAALSDITAIMNAKTTFNTITQSFTEQQSALFNAIVQKNVLTTKHTITGAVIYSDAKPVSITSGLVKYAVIGFVGGLFVACLIIACGYILSGTIKTKDDLVACLGYYGLGNIMIAKKFTGFGAKLDAKLYKKDEEYQSSFEHRQDLLVSNIKAICKKDSIEKLVMSSTVPITDVNQDTIDKLIGILKDNGIEAVFGGNVLNSVVAFDQMAEVKNLVLLEKLGETKLKDVEKLAGIVNEYDVNVVGFVCI